MDETTSRKILGALKETLFCLSEVHDENILSEFGSVSEHEAEEPDCSYCRAIKRARKAISLVSQDTPSVPREVQEWLDEFCVGRPILAEGQFYNYSTSSASSCRFNGARGFYYWKGYRIATCYPSPESPENPNKMFFYDFVKDE